MSRRQPQSSQQQSTRSSQQEIQPPPLPKNFNPDKYVRPNMSREEVIELKQAFDIFDDDGSGTIDPSELRAAFEDMGFKSQSRMIYRILAELDRDNSGGIDFDEFVRIASARQAMQNNRKDLRQAFELFDWNTEGRITWDELKKVAQELGEYEDDEQVRQMFKKADLDQDGFVTFEDFYLIMTNDKIYWG